MLVVLMAVAMDLQSINSLVGEKGCVDRAKVLERCRTPMPERFSEGWSGLLAFLESIIAKAQWATS